MLRLAARTRQRPCLENYHGEGRGFRGIYRELVGKEDVIGYLSPRTFLGREGARGRA